MLEISDIWQWLIQSPPRFKTTWPKETMGFGDENVLDFAQVALCAGANDTTSDKRLNLMVSQFHVNRVKILKGYMNINPVSSQIFSRSKIGLVPCVSSLTFQFLVNNSTYIQQK